MSSRCRGSGSGPDDLAVVRDPVTRAKLEVLAGLSEAAGETRRPRIRLAYRLNPRRVPVRTGCAVEFTCTDGTGTVTLESGLVLSSIGYRGSRSPDCPSTTPHRWSQPGGPGPRPGHRPPGGRRLRRGMD